MTIRSILVPLFPDIAFDNQLAAAVDLARTVEAYIDAVFVMPDPVSVIAGVPAVALAAGVSAETIRRDGDTAAMAAKEKFERWCREEGLAASVADRSARTPYARWSERIGEIGPVVSRCGRLSDLIVIGRPHVSLAASEAFDGAVFESGRPTLLVDKKTSRDLLRHVVIAWNGSREAARAVAGAVTLLDEAQQVSIFTTLDDGTLEQDLDLADSLSWHGINPRYVRPQPGENSAAKALLRVLGDIDASMLVMGAYTHSRLRETLLGGVTRDVLAYADVPVLMAR
jgi:nucleotide-binding universal stress UspA family protein